MVGCIFQALGLLVEAFETQMEEEKHAKGE